MVYDDDLMVCGFPRLTDSPSFQFPEMILGPVTSQIACVLLAYAYPAYSSFKAATSSGRDAAAAQKEWLIYW